ncbi:MAG TPA: hypothetical protein VF763_07090 [Candidatus Limnocylindrales bacterium]
MLDPAVALPLALFAVLAALFVLVLRRAGTYLAETHESETFRRAVADLAERAEQSLGGVAERIDAVRRHQLPPEAIGPNLAAASEAVRRYVDEAEGLAGAPAQEGVRALVVAELERAGRALEMVGHGCDLLASVRGGHRQFEAQTAIKRGYLNILHAREAIARHAADLSAPPAPTGERWLSRRRGA